MAKTIEELIAENDKLKLDAIESKKQLDIQIATNETLSITNETNILSNKKLLKEVERINEENAETLVSQDDIIKTIKEEI